MLLILLSALKKISYSSRDRSGILPLLAGNTANNPVTPSVQDGMILTDYDNQDAILAINRVSYFHS
jgi:hypothetical protein